MTSDTLTLGAPYWETVVPHNSGYKVEVPKGHFLRVRGFSIVDFVVFDQHNLRERFDQGRTKTNQNTIYISTGHVLYSKSNLELMTIVEDTYDGNHDLQKGMCSRSRHELAFRKGLMKASYLREITWDELPDHGCWENLQSVLTPIGVAPEDIPSPFNIFQHMAIDAVTGSMTNSSKRPAEPDGAYITLHAEMDCLAALSACPDLAMGGKQVHLSLFAPAE